MIPPCTKREEEEAGEGGEGQNKKGGEDIEKTKGRKEKRLKIKS